MHTQLHIDLIVYNATFYLTAQYYLPKATASDYTTCVTQSAKHLTSDLNVTGSHPPAAPKEIIGSVLYCCVKISCIYVCGRKFNHVNNNMHVASTIFITSISINKQ